MTNTTRSARCLLLAGLLASLVALSVAIPNSASGQPVVGARNTALGGGGTAYINGIEATFWNPANLAIPNRITQWYIGVGYTGIFHESVLSTDVANDQFFNFTDVYHPHRDIATAISESQRRLILRNNYPRNRLTSQHQTRADITLGGIHLQKESEAYSIVARARFASRIEVGRGWYSNDFIEQSKAQVRDFTLTQQRNHFYELSFGYAREFTFVNGLSPRINKLYIGIAPKFVLAGPSINLNYDARYLRSLDENREAYASSFSYESTGNYSEAIKAYRGGSNAQSVIANNFNRKVSVDNTGYGLGIDFGLTYLIPLGDDFSTITSTDNESVVSKSIRIALSVNDIGLVRYSKQPFKLSAPKDTVDLPQESPVNSMFVGANGQYLSFFDKNDILDNPLLTSKSTGKDNFTSLLPTSINAGVMIQYSRLRLMGDLTLGLNNTAFTNTKLAIHLGLEAYPLQQWPLRLGTRLAAGLPTRLGIGTGVKMKHWELNVGTQFLIRSRTFTSEIVGGAFAGIQLHF